MIIGIISPYSGDIEANKAYLKAIMSSILDEGHEPIAGHAMYPDALDDNDPEQRAKGMKAGQELLRVCSEVRIYTERGISKGMWEDIEFCRSNYLPLHVCVLGGGIPLTPDAYAMLRHMAPNGMRIQPV